MVFALTTGTGDANGKCYLVMAMTAGNGNGSSNVVMATSNDTGNGNVATRNGMCNVVNAMLMITDDGNGTWLC